MKSGIINVYKEKGFTSFDVVAKLRGILKTKKIGHTGTLDPDAEGVLPVCIGRATKVCDILTDKDKVYEELINEFIQVYLTTEADVIKKPDLYTVFMGDNQSGTVSFISDMDCEEMAQKLGKRGVAVRAGLHCAPLAHESAGTLETGTVRVSFGLDANLRQVAELDRILWEIEPRKSKKL